VIIYAASDLHGNLPDVPEDCELLLLGGDICPDFLPTHMRSNRAPDKGEVRQAAWLNTTFRGWLYSLVDRGVEVVSTWGNHDFVGEKRFLVPDLPWTLLVDSEASVKGLSIYGTPWVPGLPYWAFYGRPEALQARAEAIPAGVDILITHGPPYRVGDFIPTSEKQRNKYGNHGGMHVGDPTLCEAISRAQPEAVVCGHIHEARGTYYLNGSTIYNASAVDEVYRLHDDPFMRIVLSTPAESR
jgi:Icc-related predicted phosphoesterase